MYHQRPAVERIVATEIMKLERRQAIERANAEGVSPTEAPGGRPTGARPVVPAPTRRGR